MAKTIISEGKTSTEAIEKGLKELKVSRNQVEIKVLEEKKKSFFNILDPHIVKVELTVKENSAKHQEQKPNKISEEKKPDVSKEELEDAKKKVDEFLSKFLKLISESITYKIEVDSEKINVVINGEDSTKLIGYRGEALNSLQTLLTIIANNNKENDVKVILDIGEYKEARRKTLEELSLKIEKTVTKTGKAITLEPMTAYERKIIHTKLQDSKTVKTYSIGENDHRRVVIAKK